ENAEYDVRADTFDKLQKRAAPKRKRPPPTDDADVPGEMETGDDNDNKTQTRPIITVDSTTMPVADVLHQVTDRLLAAGNCFSRTEQLVVINDQQISPILSSPELAGLLNQYVEFYFVDDEAGEYNPFPSAYANTWLNQHVE